MPSIPYNDMISYNGIASNNEFPECPLAYKQFTIIENAYVPKSKPNIEEVNSISASVIIKEVKLINSPYDTKLLVSGVIKQKIIYTAHKPDQPVHNFHFDIPFCELIILDGKQHCHDSFEVQAFIEDIHVFFTGKRKLKVCKVICLCVTHKKGNLTNPKQGCNFEHKEHWDC
ncbi:DUF3794 domain-containing protein [Pontibacillus salipaludis]|uniref:SipL SPOCS domain-containing protein n=1 Tax=Pontibacillus salipaludis TaxID=1697394 RepID=A0ABQ1Q089_9BACI|nr:DUF3794 domain-containing protein [Pontibacillus salipaludis]GGD09043.1 hypothetical protein GCM10011389_15730 [Pontibacillus salipaludis]